MLTGANAVITLSQPTLFPIPQQLQGFAADDVTDMEPARVLEELMGVDGVLSFGFVWEPRRQNITLQADSASCSIFDTIMSSQQANQTVYPLTGVVILPAIGLMFNLINGGLETYNPMPQVRRIIRERKFRIVWNQVLPRPTL